MITRTAELRHALAALLTGEDSLHDPQWRKAVEAVPREAFLGEAVFRRIDGAQGTQWQPLHRGDIDDDEWLRLIYANETHVTQVAGVAATDTTTSLTGTPTSSSSMPAVVVRMLEVAGIAEGDSVLEIGTGTGYSTALMCQRLGNKAVTSIEYDPVVAERARKAITATGYEPTLVVGDGLAGYEKNSEYDRLIATCAVRYIPAPWMWQVRDGGTITVPLWGWMNGYALAHLTLADDGTASGHFDPYDVSFMPARPHASPPLSHYLLGQGDDRESRIDPKVLDDWTGVFVAQLAAPSAQLMGGGDEMILLDVATGSQATTKSDQRGGWTVRQYGPLRLWDAVEEAIVTWQNAGSSHQSAFGLTVTGEGQYVWLGDSHGPSWNLPA